MSFSRDDFTVSSEQTLWKGFFEVVDVSLRHRLFDGGWSGDIRRVVARRRQAVGVLIYDPALDALAVAEQFRVGALARNPSPWLMELIAGLMEAGESPEDVAHRESQEEAGVTLRALEKVASYYSSPGGSDEYFHLYCGCADLSAAAGVHGLAEENEDIRLHVLPVNDVLAMMDDGRIDNAHSLVALNWFARHHNRLRDLWR
ncbi:NUDIX domain-containing protein [Litorivivens sp.]|uniref:NUDIX domain-containing protein n=1 Tax=Litorivivens sp. TaxID=2020868 RepID=UPI0035632DBF